MTAFASSGRVIPSSEMRCPRKSILKNPKLTFGSIDDEAIITQRSKQLMKVCLVRLGILTSDEEFSNVGKARSLPLLTSSIQRLNVWAV